MRHVNILTWIFPEEAGRLSPLVGAVVHTKWVASSNCCCWMEQLIISASHWKTCHPSPTVSQQQTKNRWVMELRAAARGIRRDREIRRVWFCLRICVGLVHILLFYLCVSAGGCKWATYKSKHRYILRLIRKSGAVESIDLRENLQPGKSSITFVGGRTVAAPKLILLICYSIIGQTLNGTATFLCEF